MDNKFLHKVLDQLVYETRIDYDRKVIETPHLLSSFTPLPSFSRFFSIPFIPTSFSDHCKDVYGLNDDEIEYVWKVYSDDIVYKIENNGL